MGSSTLVDAETTEELLEIRASLATQGWLIGDLSYQLYPLQQKILKSLFDALSRGSRRYTIEAGRQVGKTRLLVTLANMLALQSPGQVIIYGAPSLKHMRDFVHPAFADVARDAPEGMAPTWNSVNDHYSFSNGAQVHLFGAKDEYNVKNFRGRKAIAALFDEAAFCTVLELVLQDAFGPALQLRDGFQVLSSSPADVPEHPFTKICEIDEARDCYAHASWLDNTMLTDERRAAWSKEKAEEAGQTIDEYTRSAKYRREYLGERVVDPALVGFPEWEELRKTNLLEVPRPGLFRGQEGIDWGGVDPHFIVFFYWHPEFGVVVEDELFLRDGETIMQVAEKVREKERTLWGVDAWDGTLAGLDRTTLQRYFNDKVPQWALDASAKRRDGQPWMRSCDTDTQLAIEFRSHGLLAIPARKSGIGFGKQLRVDALRVLMRKRQLWVHPRCKKLDRDLRATTWSNSKRSEWARRADGSHGDGCDALDYGYTNIETDMPLEAPPLRLTSAAAARESSLLGNSPMARLLMQRRR